MRSDRMSAQVLSSRLAKMRHPSDLSLTAIPLSSTTPMLFPLLWWHCNQRAASGVLGLRENQESPQMAVYAAIDDRVPAVTAHPGMHSQLAVSDFGRAMPPCEACECSHILKIYQEAKFYVEYP